MDRDLRTILLNDNPWITSIDAVGTWLQSKLPEPYLQRQVSQGQGLRWQEPNRAHLVIGPRQAGKSTTIWASLAEAGSPVLLIDCEQLLVQDWCQSAPLFLAELEKLLAAPVPLFFEEVQHLPNAGLFLKGLVDRRIGVPILVTGSSSYHLGAQTRESLAGRATRTRLLPFSLAEVCQDLADRPDAVRAHLMEERFQRHLVIGGYPEVWLSDSPEVLLTDIVEAIILRDASDLFQIRRPDAFRRLLRLAAGQVGSLINLSEWASVLGISRDTVASYLEILESGHVTVALPPFAGGRRAELSSTPKVFFIDTGIRNKLALDLRAMEERTDLGPLLESWVFSELWKLLPGSATLHFWRSSSGAEVDFVLTDGVRVVGVEVKAARLQRPKIPRAARSFVEAYGPTHLFIVNLGFAHEEHLAGTTVQWITPPELAAQVCQAFAETL